MSEQQSFWMPQFTVIPRDRQTKTRLQTGSWLALPRRLELRSSAPEADTLSTELREQATRFYHNHKPSRRVPHPTTWKPMFLPQVQAPQVPNVVVL